MSEQHSEAMGFVAELPFEATLDRVVLRRCEPCFERGTITPHPLATGHPDGACPVCGAPTLRGEVLPTVTAVVDQDAASNHFGA